MGTFSDAYEEIVLKIIFGDDHADLIPDDLYVCLFTSDPDGVGFDDEVSGNAYDRVEVANTTANWTVSGDSVENANAVTFPEATGAWGTVTHWGLADHATDNDPENLITSAPLATAQSPVLGDTPEFAAGTLEVGAD